MTNMYFQISSLFYLIMIIILFFSKEKLKSIDTKIFKYLSIITLLMITSDIVIVYLSHTNPELKILYFLNKFYLLTILYWIIIFGVYFSYIATRKKKKINYNKYAKIIAVVSSLMIILLPLHLFKENGIITYTYGASVTVLYIMCAAVVAYVIFILIINKKNVISKKYIPITTLLFLALIALAVRLLDPDLLLTTSIATFITILMYHTIENPDVKMIEQLDLAKDAAEKANMAKSDFLSSMSHEIRTPLNAIVGLSQDMLDKESLPKEFKEDATDIVNASNTLLEIVGNIIDISKIESSKMEIILTEYSITEIVDSIVKLNEIRIKDKDIDLKVNYAKNLPYELLGDKNHLKQVINNLVSNALKYTEKGYVKVSVKCINKETKSTIIISVEDTGKGIKKENLGRLFEKFDRLDAEKNSTVEGTGLGLAITKKLVDLIGGKISVQSSFGYGSLFVVSINQKISKLYKPVKIKDSEEEDNRSLILKDKKVLIVDDNLLNIKVAKRALIPLEVLTEECMSGKECLELVKKNNYDFILMDIMMPELSGEETLKELKKNQDFNTPVIALTADATSGSKRKYEDLGFSSYVAKPFNKDQIKKELEKVMNKK